MNRLVKKIARYILGERMATAKIDIHQILFHLENEHRKLKGERVLNWGEFQEIPPEKQKWEVIPGVFSAPQVEIKDGKKSEIGKSIVFKFFANRKTREVRQFVSKFTNEPETKDLK